MSNEPEHTYTREMMIDRLSEIRDIFYDERSKVGALTSLQQVGIGEQIGNAISELKE